MIRFQRLPNVSLTGGTSVPPIPRTPEGLAMGAVPGWVLFHDPDFTGPSGVRNRAQRQSFSPSSSFAIGAFDSGQTAFHATDETTLLITGSTDINPQVFSVFWVIQPETDSLSTPNLIRPVETPASGELGLRVTLSTDGERLNMSGGDLTWRATYTPPEGRGFSLRSTPSLVMVTFSIRDGIRFFDNGELVRHIEDDKRPLTVGHATGEWELFRFARGRYGMHGVLNIDLGWPEHAGYRRNIERFLIGKYAIS